MRSDQLDATLCQFGIELVGLVGGVPNEVLRSLPTSVCAIVALTSVPAGGGKPEPATTLAEREVAQRWPQMLPHDRGILYTASTAQGSYGDALIAVQPRPPGPAKVLVRGGYFGRYLAGGHVVYLHDDTLFAAPFDLDRLEPTGSFLPVLEHVSGSMLAGAGGGPGQFAVADTGTAVYFAGGATSGASCR